MYCVSLRLNVLPKAVADFFPFFFLIGIIPIIYWFEIWVVLPEVYPLEIAPLMYSFLFILGHFLLFNVVGNFIGVIFIDTSIKGREMPQSDSLDAAGYCDECKAIIPARAYHCPTCQICVLRRDHHCLFSACCIGQFNYRYFLMFLLHMFLSTAICLPLNISYLWDYFSFINFKGILSIIFPVIMLFYGTNFDLMQCYFILFSIAFLGMLIIGTWFFFHIRLAFKGKVVHEMRKNIGQYDLGWIDNLKEVMGERWHLVWLSPFISSKLTCDGIHFKTKPHIQ